MALNPEKIEVGALVYSAPSSPTSSVPCKKIILITDKLNAYALSNPGEKEKDIYERDKFFIEDAARIKDWYHTKLEALEVALRWFEEGTAGIAKSLDLQLSDRKTGEAIFKELIRKEREKLG